MSERCLYERESACRAYKYRRNLLAGSFSNRVQTACGKPHGMDRTYWCATVGAHQGRNARVNVDDGFGQNGQDRLWVLLLFHGRVHEAAVRARSAGRSFRRDIGVSLGESLQTNPWGIGEVYGIVFGAFR